MTRDGEDGESTTTVDVDDGEATTTDDRDVGSEGPGTESDSSGSTEPADGGGRPPVSDVDDAAEHFVDLENELRSIRGDVTDLRGRAVDVRRIDASEVPERYPRTIASAQALELQVIPGDDRLGAERSVYFEWPPGDDGQLATLMSLRGVSADEFAALHGREVPLAIEDGFLVPDLPRTQPRGSDRGVYGVVLGTGVNLAAFGAIALGAGSLLNSLPVFLGLLLVNFVLLPIATYLDGWYLRTHTDWDHGPVFWATLAFLVGFNVLSSMAYLYTRRSATPL